MSKPDETEEKPEAEEERAKSDDLFVAWAQMIVCGCEPEQAGHVVSGRTVES